MKIVSLVTVVIALLVSSESQARTHHRHITTHYRVAQSHAFGGTCDPDNNGRCVYSGGPKGQPVIVSEARRPTSRHTAYGANYNAVQYVGSYPTYRPAGAHHRWCGDGVSIAVFGRMVPGLSLASEWYHRFPAAAPGRGMVAARDGHVKLITGGSPGNWTCYDPNSGGGVAHSGPCSLAGFHIVNPSGGTVYSARTHHRRYASRY